MTGLDHDPFWLIKVPGFALLEHLDPQKVQNARCRCLPKPVISPVETIANP